MKINFILIYVAQMVDMYCSYGIYTFKIFKLIIVYWLIYPSINQPITNCFFIAVKIKNCPTIFLIIIIYFERKFVWKAPDMANIMRFDNGKPLWKFYCVNTNFVKHNYVYCNIE